MRTEQLSSTRQVLRIRGPTDTCYEQVYWSGNGELSYNLTVYSKLFPGKLRGIYRGVFREERDGQSAAWLSAARMRAVIQAVVRATGKCCFQWKFALRYDHDQPE